MIDSSGLINETKENEIKVANRIIKVKNKISYLTAFTNSSSIFSFVVANKYKKRDRIHKFASKKPAEIIRIIRAETKVAIDPARNTTRHFDEYNFIIIKLVFV
ncbi:MAG: hypothetical protein ACQER7_04070 [Bacteroidota bacterium]